jgi:cathepsin A (carboxypeptidase C)
MQVNQGFFFQGDGMHNSAALLIPLLNDGIKLLVYAGNADGMCNYMVLISTHSSSDASVDQESL